MKSIKLFSTFFITLFLLSITFALQGETDTLKDIDTAAKKWLQFIDAGKYGDSWDLGSTTFKLTFPKERWVMLMDQIRQPLGSLSSREILDQRTAKDPEGLPAGDYMVLIYKTSFSKKEAAHELVTLVLESDNQWRVLTYQVQ